MRLDDVVGSAAHSGVDGAGQPEETGDADAPRGGNLTLVGCDVPAAPRVDAEVARILAAGAHPHFSRFSVPQVAEDSGEAPLGDVRGASASGLTTPSRNLHDHVINHGPLNKESIEKLFYELLSALVCLHDKGIVHRNVTAESIIWHDDSFLLSDFNKAAVVGDDDIEARDADMFGAGATFYFAVTGVWPVEGQLDFGEPFHGVDSMLRDLIITLRYRDESDPVSAQRALEIVCEARDKRPSNPIAPYPRIADNDEPPSPARSRDPDDDFSVPASFGMNAPTWATTTASEVSEAGRWLAARIRARPHRVSETQAMQDALELEAHDERRKLRRHMRGDICLSDISSQDAAEFSPRSDVSDSPSQGGESWQSA